MSKKFKPQEYFRYKRLGTSWRKPKGRQSKMRESRGGSGRMPTIGRKGKPKVMPVIINSIRDMEKIQSGASVLLASAVGTKKAIAIRNEAEKRGIKIINKRRIKDAEFRLKKIKEGKIIAEKEKELKKREEEAKKKREEERKKAKKDEKTAEKKAEEKEKKEIAAEKKKEEHMEKKQAKKEETQKEKETVQETSGDN